MSPLFTHNENKKTKKEYQRKETIIMPGVEHGIIPTQILPEDMAGVMTKYYEKIFPPDKRKLLHISEIAFFLIVVFGLTIFAGIIWTLWHEADLYGNTIVPLWFRFIHNS